LLISVAHQIALTGAVKFDDVFVFVNVSIILILLVLNAVIVNDHQAVCRVFAVNDIPTEPSGDISSNVPPIDQDTTNVSIFIFCEPLSVYRLLVVLFHCRNPPPQDTVIVDN
jgi:hypothetical protein